MTLNVGVSNRRRLSAVLLAGALLSARAVQARADITFGQIDNFQDATTMGWAEGVASPNPPTNEPGGGPGGASDRYLRNVSSGEGVAGGKQIMFNTTRWAGDYNAAGVTRLEGMIANFGDAPLYARIAINDGLGTRFASTTPTVIPPDGAWRPVTFDINATTMTQLFGAASLTSALGHVVELRILSAQSAPTYMGDDVPSVLGLDNLRALRLPGDANFDGAVDFNDLVALAQHYNSTAPANWADGDFTFDGHVDFNDLVKLAQNYNTALPADLIPGAPADFTRALAAVPEPSGLPAAVAVCALAAAPRRRRARITV